MCYCQNVLVYGKVYNKCVFEAQICWGLLMILSPQPNLGGRLQDVEKWGRFPAGFSINKWGNSLGKKGNLPINNCGFTLSKKMLIVNKHHQRKT